MLSLITQLDIRNAEPIGFAHIQGKYGFWSSYGMFFDLLFLTNRDIIASVQAHIHWQKCALAFYGWDEMGMNWDEMTVE